MSASERTERMYRALDRGRTARRSGISYDKNPYKLSPWGMGAYWQLGWMEADKELSKGGNP